MDRMEFLHSIPLTSVDSMRHLVTSEDVVKAVVFAAQAGHNVVTCYRFVSLLAMTDDLEYRAAWPVVLRRVMELERLDQLNKEALDAGVEAQRKILEGGT
jgi:hypothetical protein